MIAPLSLQGRWVLLTGASSGLGEAMARQLVRDHGAHLVLVARRAEKLQALRTELEQLGAQCQVIAADLSREADVQRVFDQATAHAVIQGVILNAGITHFGRHEELSWPDFRQLLDTNVSSLVQLASLFAPYMARQNSGGALLLVSSIAGFVPVPYQAAYAGSKAFVSNFGLSLGQELREQGLSLTVFAPGGIDTAMTQNSRLRYFENSPFLQDVDSCARDGLQAFIARKALFVPGRLNRAQLLATRLVPRPWLAMITQAAYRRALDN
ncbi:MAG TPA: SDR family NAD(P)-dependent oxidoreductase [Moraxellaceae bacterium]